MTIEESILIDAPADTVFALYRDVAGWHRWDPDTREARLDGPFAVGTRGRLVPTEGRGVPMEITALRPGRSFTVECRIPLFRMKFEHELHPGRDGTRAVHRVSFSGALAFVLGRIVGGRVRTGLPVTMRSLKAHAEAARSPQEPPREPCRDASARP